MPSRRDKLLPAEFKGVQFLIRSEALTEGGRKIVLHEYPDSSERFVEDLGGLPPRFRIEAFVSGDNWRDRSGSLERVLNEGGVGKLIMPTFGSIQAFALPYTKDASQRSVGIISFSLEFAAGKPKVAPVATIATQQEVFEKGDDARKEVQDAFEEEYDPPTFIESVQAAIGDLKDSVNAIAEEVAGKVDLETLSAIRQKAISMQNRAAQLVNNPTQFAIDFIQGPNASPGLWQLASVGYGVTGAVESVASLAEYGATLVTSESSEDVTGSAVFETTADETSENTPYWPDTTGDRITRNERRRLVVRTQRLNALIVSYEQLAAREYTTSEGITDARALVESIYQDIMLVGTGDKDAIQSAQRVRAIIDDLRNVTFEVLAQKEQEVFGLVDIEVQSPIPQFILAYQLYSEEFTDSESLTDRSKILRGLNPEENGIAMDGNLLALQDRVGA